MNSIRDFFQNAYYHCLHYIVNKKLHWFERLFWIFWITVSMGGVLYIVKQSVYNFYSTKVSLRVRTDYLDFKTPFPAIFICEKEEIRGKIPKMLDELNYTFAQSSKANMEVFVRAATFIRPMDTVRSFPSGGNDQEARRFVDTYRNNLSAFSKYIRASCEEIFTSCTYNGEEFDCCKRFLPVDTFEGKCYAINSANAIAENQPEWKSYMRKNFQKLISHKQEINKTTLTPVDYIEYRPEKNPANLSIELAHANVYAWYLGNNYFPTKMYQKNNQFEVLKTSRFLDVYLRVQEIIPDISTLDLEIQRRNCRLWYENENMRSLVMYSVSGCEIDCFRAAQLLYCGCVLHVLPNQKGLNDKLCDTEGMKCAARTEIGEYLSFNCSCTLSCLFLEVFTVGFVSNVASRNNESFRDPRSIKRLNFLVRAPTVQYHLHTHQEPLDFIVSIGGAISLCVGCSFLSLAQIFYYFVLKPFNDTLIEGKQEKMLKKKNNIQRTLLKQKQKLKLKEVEESIQQNVEIRIARVRGH